ncbi:hypothetical protein [Cytobacillus dafuensis]|uniref:Uncharacterized protein n=1 Tax=Cytobacillus dafuensis TaxID=1742359 RepID=A0A5B8Z4C5_CYTDA|nr:hypothetical protein [Cytobacillus dafuensis]QED47738.1 hypothetical protein FSZ17_10990 [Cytobacillus dafuensis]
MGIERQSALTENTLYELCNRNGSGRRINKRKPYVLALITSHLIGMEPGLSYLRDLSNAQMMLRISAEDELFSHFSLQELVNLIGNDDWILQRELSEMIINQVDIIFLPILSFSLVSDILSYNDRRLLVRIILKAILSGKKVIGLRLGADPYHPIWRMKGMDKGPQILKRKLQEQLQGLKSLGIKLIDTNEKIDFTFEKAYKKSIITEKTIRYVHQNNQSFLFISNETILTPLAKDLARELKISLITE